MKQSRIKLETEETNLNIQNIQEYPDSTELEEIFGKPFHENQTVKEVEVDIITNWNLTPN